MPISPSLVANPFRLSADCCPTAEHWTSVVDSFNTARSWLMDQHGADGAHRSRQIFLAVAKLKLPDPADYYADNVQLEMVMGQNVGKTLWTVSGFDQRGLFRVVVDFPYGMKVDGVHAVIPLRNGATFSPFDAAPACSPGTDDVAGIPSLNFFNAWTIAFGDPNVGGTPVHGDYLQFVATGVPE